MFVLAVTAVGLDFELKSISVIAEDSSSTAI